MSFRFIQDLLESVLSGEQEKTDSEVGNKTWLLRLRNGFFYYINRPFLRNVSIVALGPFVSQMLSILFSPIITRLYGPSEFGALGVFLSVLSVLVPISNLSYSYAIIMPKKEVDGLKILRFCLIFGLIISLFSFVIIVLLNEPITTLLKFEGYSKYLYFLPLALLFSNSAIIFDQWIVRRKKFKTSSVISISQSLLSNGSLIGLGYLSPQFASLIGVNVLSRGYHAIASLFGSGVLPGGRDQKSECEGVSSGKKLRDLLKEYRDFPFYRTPQILISTLSYNLPIMLMSGFFGTEAAGYYSLAHRVLKLPSIIISDSVGKVFQQHATETAQKGSSLQPLIIKTTLLLAFIGALPLGLIILFGPFLFSFVFGAEWDQAGLFARWVAIWVLVTFISAPVVVATPLLELQKQYLIFEVVSLFLSIISLVIGFVILENSLIAVALFSITNAFLIALFVIFVIIKSKDRNRFQMVESK